MTFKTQSFLLDLMSKINRKRRRSSVITLFSEFAKDTLISVMVITAFLSGCRSVSMPRQSFRQDIQQLIMHACERLSNDQGSVEEIRMVGIEVFGLDAENAIVCGNFYVINSLRHENLAQVYPLILRTVNGGRTWMHVLDPIEHRVNDFEEIRFIDKRHGWIHWANHVEGNYFDILRTQNGGLTWQECKLNGIMGSYTLVDWAMTSPLDGICVVDSHFQIPVDGNLDTEVAFWVLKTTDGGRNWNIIQTIPTSEEDKFSVENTVPKAKWIEPDPSWSVFSKNDAFLIKRLTTKDKSLEALRLPKTIDRNLLDF